MWDESPTRRLTVETSGERIDRYLASSLLGLSRTRVQRLLASGDILVNGAPVAASYAVAQGDVIDVALPAPVPVALRAEPIPIDIVYEDDAMLVINKAPGMVVHPGAGHPSGTLVNAILAHCPDLPGIAGEVRPGIVHRLDQDTSGLIVVAKHDQALRRLQHQFQKRTVRKHYTALVIGRLPRDEGLIDAPIGRHGTQRRRMAVRQGGKAARTRWRVTAQYRDETGRYYSLVDVRLLTGRTHQIRVHFAWMGCPVAGDAVYGSAGPAASWPRQFLHARELALEHPVTGAPLSFTAPLAEDLLAALARLEATA